MSIFEECPWRDLKVGDVIQLRKGEICPADCIVLDTSEAKNKKSMCYIATTGINGQRSLIKKFAPNLTRRDIGAAGKGVFHEYSKLLSGTIEYAKPNSDMFSFQGFLKLNTDPKNEALNIENFLPRGGQLRNTDW